MLEIEEVRRRIGTASVGLAVIDTDGHVMAEVNEAFCALVGRTRAETVGRPVADLLSPESSSAAAVVLDGLRAGWIDSCEGTAAVRNGDGSLRVRAWGLPLGPNAPHPAVVIGAVAESEPGPAAFDPYRIDVSAVILGSLDHDWRFSDVDLASASRLRWPADQEGRARVQEIVHPLDIPVLLAALGRSGVEERPGVAQVRVAGSDGEWIRARLTVSPLCRHVTPRFGVAICLLGGAEQPESPADRLARLEEHLVRIGTEVRSSGIAVPSVGSHYIDLAELTDRQNEIVRRLAAGQRVPAIARDLFVTASTVRNHLSAIYRKLDVTSQSELLERLRGQSGRL